jgi:septal ring factor EnvC (AmiA/AmiB activator)
MERLARRALGLSLALCFLATPRTDAASVTKDLEGIRRKIETEKQGISRVQKKEGSVLQSLGQIENDLDKKNRELKLAMGKLNSISRELAGMEADSERLNSSVKQRQELLKQRAAALYRWHKGASPFVILNGAASWGAFLQRKRYLEATISFDRNLVQKLTEELRQQDILRGELTDKREELDGQKKVLDEAKQSVRKEAEKKKEILASLRREKETRVRALKELEQAALRLQKMMDEIARRSASRPQDAPSSGIGLDAMRGKLEWPVKGEVTSGFGKAKHREFAAEVFHKGIAIEAPLGQQIKSVERGKVVFADRFAGYGKMVIVDHGERFYTIYAHLSEMLKKQGDEIRRGEILGLVGESDSLAGAKLYFEIRKDGRSIDPVPWFRKY